MGSEALIFARSMGKVKIASFTTQYAVVTKTVDVEAHRCEQLARSRYTAMLCSRIELARPLDGKSDALPLLHHATDSLSIVKVPSSTTP